MSADDQHHVTSTVEPVRKVAPQKETVKPSVSSAELPIAYDRGRTAADHDDGGDLSAWDEKLAILADSSSAMAESFRYLRTKILHPPSGQPLRRVLVTSAMPDEGKSLVCAALGISLAQGLEQHALLIDCDLRRSSLARLFAVKDEKGLVNYLRDGLEVSQLIRKTGLRKLSLIPSGAKPLNPAELLDSIAIGHLFEELSSRYDDRFTLIDTPPLQAASETAVLAKHVDGIILVTRWGRGGREQIKKLTATLDADKIIGVVFNGCETNFMSSKLSGYESYGQYGSKQGY
jgi:capsular exopolysaccharide synthesis family protein